MLTRRVEWSAAALAPALLAGGAGLGPTDGTGGAPPPDPDPPPVGSPDQGSLLCNLNASVKADGPALIVRDPAVLSHFPLQKVLQQLIDRAGAVNPITPE